MERRGLLGSRKFIVPLTVGALLIGEKKSERRFIEEDLRLLYAVRSEAESALDRVELVQRAYEETLAEGRVGDRARPKGGAPLSQPVALPPRRHERVDLLPLVQDAVAIVEPEAALRPARDAGSCGDPGGREAKSRRLRPGIHNGLPRNLLRR